ncbi:hypothetical protein [Bacillus sp. T33-2]|uniref:hypothetical protein n=1 Tax=Bacillus sp. T33-2 TaxID=2054168 RepID=UPI000C761CEA|nr:hypothetical protein [Bacillus sp. T33-2]PLR98213.1 hypothetical protein CVD19_06355 [Bacillus sp. T33-2]
MDFILLIAGAAVIITCFYFIVSPFFAGNRGEAAAKETGEERLTLDMVYGAVNELEMDYLMKKVNEKDFVQMKEQYQLLASEIMKQESKPKSAAASKNRSDQAELEILRELQKLRKQEGR